MNFAAVNEAKLQLGPRTDDYIILTVTTLAKMDTLTLDGVKLQFRPVADGQEALYSSVPRKGSRYWRLMQDKDERRVFRKLDGGVMNVYWG
jgi:hypothetical protein